MKIALKSPRVLGTHLIELRKMKDWVNHGTTSWFWTTLEKLIHFITMFSLPTKHLLPQINNRNSRTRCEICSKLTTIKPPEQRPWRRSGVFIVNFEHISPFSSVSVVNFEQVNDCWVILIFSRTLLQPYNTTLLTLVVTLG